MHKYIDECFATQLKRAIKVANEEGAESRVAQVMFIRAVNKRDELYTKFDNFVAECNRYRNSNV